jgi:hypothetical protein
LCDTLMSIPIPTLNNDATALVRIAEIRAVPNHRAMRTRASSVIDAAGANNGIGVENESSESNNGRRGRSKSGIVPVARHHAAFILRPSKLAAVSGFRIILPLRRSWKGQR